MRWIETADVAVPAAELWDVVSAVEAWPAWATPFTDVAALHDGGLVPGGQYELAGRDGSTRRWIVTRLEPGRGFTWEARAHGRRVVVRYVVTPDGPWASRLAIEIRADGLLAGLRSPWARRRAGSELRDQALAFKRAAEFRARSAGPGRAAVAA